MQINILKSITFELWVACFDMTFKLGSWISDNPSPLVSVVWFACMYLFTLLCDSSYMRVSEASSFYIYM